MKYNDNKIAAQKRLTLIETLFQFKLQNSPYRLSHIPIHVSFHNLETARITSIQLVIWILNLSLLSLRTVPFCKSMCWLQIRNLTLNTFENSMANGKSFTIFVFDVFFLPFFRPQMLMLQLSCPMQYLTRMTQNVLRISIQGPYSKKRQSNPKMTVRMSLGQKQTSAAFVTRCTPALPPYAHTCALTQERSHTSVTSVWSHSLRMPI